MEELTINEVAKRAGIRASAIRYYESVQLLPPPQRSAGRRRYTPAVLRRLSFIQVAQAAGLTLAHQKLAEVDALMRKEQGMKMILVNGLKCRCTNLEECIDCIIGAEASS